MFVSDHNDAGTVGTAKAVKAKKPAWPQRHRDGLLAKN